MLNNYRGGNFYDTVWIKVKMSPEVLCQGVQDVIKSALFSHYEL